MDHYDVLIDLYEVGYSEVVASISANDTDGLYALPLESSGLDSELVQVSTSEGSGGGSLSMLFIGLVAMVGLRRKAMMNR